MKDKHSDHTVKITSSDLGGEKECREGRFTSKQSRSLGTRLQERHYELHVPGSVDFRVYANYCCLFLQPRTRTGLPWASSVPPCTVTARAPHLTSPLRHLAHKQVWRARNSNKYTVLLYG